MFFLAALGKIGGCFSFWLWIRMHRSPLWAIPGSLSLIAFALVLTRIDSAYAGCAYAAYGGIYILSSLLWLWSIEKKLPDQGDLLGAVVCVVGAGIILLGPHTD
jgi:small multidrug resistance family-3 protein